MKNVETESNEGKAISLHRPKFGLFYVVVLGASLAWPSLLWAGASFLGHPLSLDSQRNGGPDRNGGTDKGQQAPSPQRPPKGDDGPGSNRPPAKPQSPRNGGDRPQHGPSRPGANPRPPQTGGPVVKPGRPGPGPVRPPVNNHPPVHTAPRPPVHHHPGYGPGRPHFVWGPGNGWRLHQFFLGDIHRMHRMHRHHLFIGGYFPRIFLDRVQPIPPGLMVYLPPVPPGYEIGYYDGYCLVYDPQTLVIVSVIDLYRY
jgi:hypothetical protein